MSFTPCPDPADVAVANDAAVRLVALMMKLERRDVILLWRQAEGCTDQEILEELQSLDTPSSLSSIRKQRQRARQRLAS